MQGRDARCIFEQQGGRPRSLASCAATCVRRDRKGTAVMRLHLLVIAWSPVQPGGSKACSCQGSTGLAARTGLHAKVGLHEGGDACFVEHSTSCTSTRMLDTPHQAVSPASIFSTWQVVASLCNCKLRKCRRDALLQWCAADQHA
jgi:hypothetical protein